MKTLRLSTALFAAGALIALASCGSDDDKPDKTYYEAVSSSSFTYVTDRATGVGRVFEGPTYRLKFDNETFKATLTMENVRYTDGESPRTVVFENLPWTNDNRTGARVIDVDAAGSVGTPSLSVADLEIKVLEKAEVAGAEMEGVAVSYEVLGVGEVTNVPYRAVFAGATETVNSSSGSSYVSTEPTYAVDVDPRTMTAVLKITDPAFDPNMPKLGAMEFAGLSVTIVDGGYILSSESLTPSIGGTPFPRYQITGLRMSADLGGDSELKFTCMGVFSVTASFEATYTP